MTLTLDPITALEGGLVGVRGDQTIRFPDPRQQAVRDHRGPLLRVLGGPGTGKTQLAIDVVAQRVRAGEVRADQCVVLAPTRQAAGRLRDGVTLRAGAASSAPLARTFASLSFGLLRSAAIRDDAPTPYLLSGPEQDAVLRELLAGHRRLDVPGPQWPAEFTEALTTDGFRGQLRDLLMRAVENGLDAPALAALGRTHARPEWVAAATVLAEYDEVTALSRPGAFDPAWLVSAAGDLLSDDPAAGEDLAARLRLVVVDDAQEVTAAGGRLLALMADLGIDLVLLGDPDAAVHSFRGADPRLLAHSWQQLLPAARGTGVSITLETGYRQAGPLAQTVARASSLVGALGGGGQRAWEPHASLAPGQLHVDLFRSGAQEAAHIADIFRRAHLLEGTPWRRMAVIVRGQGRSDVLRRVLTAHRVPVAPAGSDLPMRAEDAVAPLLTLMELATERVAHRLETGGQEIHAEPDAGWRIRPEVAVDLLTSPYGGADAITLRRLRRALRRPALACGEAARPDELLAEALLQPADLVDLGPEGAGARRVARMLSVATAVLERSEPDAAQVLWALWESAGLAEEWRAAALAGGRAGRRADRDLDAVIAVLSAAADFSARLPGIGPDAFVRHLSAQDLAADRVVARAAGVDAVEILTPHSAAGRGFEIVAVAGVQEGAWPDLRLRGSLLHAEELVDVLAGRDRSPRAARSAVRHDEARLLHVALSRGRRAVHVSAVRDDTEQPSPYLDLLDPLPHAGTRPFTETEDPMDLVGVVGGLRRRLGQGPDEAAAGLLARLAEHGIRGADPSTWWGLREVTDDRPRVPGTGTVRLSPSALVGLSRCQLRHLLTRCGGEGPAIGSAALGTLVHEVIASAKDASARDMSAVLDRNWQRLGLPTSWVGRKQRAEAGAMLERAERYFTYARAQGWTRLAAEEQMRVVIGRAEISGVVDRLEEDSDGRLRVVDYKTGSAKPSRDEVRRHPQLGAYQVAVEAGAFPAGRVSAGAALVQLGKAGDSARVATAVQEQDALREASDPAWAADLLADAAEVLAGAHFVASVGSHCATCPVRSSCPAQPEGGRLV